MDGPYRAGYTGRVRPSQWHARHWRTSRQWHTMQWQSAPTDTQRGACMGVYEQLGLKSIINASGAVTRLGGAVMPPEVLTAWHDAALATVPLEQLQAAASRRIAQATGTEAGLVTAGCAAALTLGTAAILARYDLARIEQLPHCDAWGDRWPNEMLIAREQRSGYDHAVRGAGARLVEVGFNEIVANAGVRRTEPWEYEAAISPRTAGIVYVFGPSSRPSLAEVVAVAKHHDVPVLVDAAGELPPRSNLTAIAAAGADLVCFSGGKAIRGPQATGILCGRRDLVGSAALQMLDMDEPFDLWEPPPELIDKQQLAGIPRHGLGRSMKVAKEEIVALLTALDLFASGGYDAQLSAMHQVLEQIADALREAPCACQIVEGADGESPPTLLITLNEAALDRSALDVCRALRHGDPPVYVGHGRLDQGQLVVRPQCLSADQTPILAKRLCAELRRS